MVPAATPTTRSKPLSVGKSCLYPLIQSNSTMSVHAVRLLPSMSGWLRVLEPSQKLSIVAHHEIEAFSDFASTRMSLQHQLRALQQERGLGRVFLSGQLFQSPIQVFRDTQIDSHGTTVPTRYLAVPSRTPVRAH